MSEQTTHTTGEDHEFVYAIPGENHIIDSVRADGLTWVNGRTAAEVLAEYPDARRYTFDEWLTEKAGRQQTPITWAPVTAEQYSEMFEVLPPLAFNGWSFLVSEPCDHCAATGRPRYQGYRMLGLSDDTRRYEVASRPTTIAEWRQVRESR